MPPIFFQRDPDPATSIPLYSLSETNLSGDEGGGGGGRVMQEGGWPLYRFVGIQFTSAREIKLEGRE